MLRRIRFPFRSGALIAAPPKAWGEEFQIIERGPSDNPFTQIATSAVVDICGPLEQHDGFFCDSYDAIRKRCAAAFESESDTVILRINSPGGDFAGSIELARELKATAKQLGKRLIAFTDSSALSAGYILACAASEVVVTPSAFVGSIGVWTPIVDETKRDQAMGLSVVIVASGERKVDGNPHVKITEAAVESTQAQVDAMAALFFELVAESRPLDMKGIISLQGGQKFGQGAVNMGLADRVVNSWSEFLTTLEQKAMAKSYEEARSKAREQMAKVAEGDDEDGKRAKAWLAADDEAHPDEDKEKKAEGGEKKEEASAASAKASDDDDAKAKAASEDEEKKAADEKDEAKAQASAKTFDLAARVHALETERRLEKEAAVKATLFASRPDFSPEVKASLSELPIASIRKACETWKRGTIPSTHVEASAPTLGKTQGVDVAASASFGQSEEDFIQAKMYGGAPNTGVVASGRTLTLGAMSHEDAEIALKKLSSKGNA